MEHILSGCQSLAGSKYLERHNKAATVLYLALLEQLGIPPRSDDPYYKYTPDPVVENENAKVYWDKTIVTDATVIHNRPDITVINKANKTVSLIDVSIPSNHNIERKYTEKIDKYTDLRREVQLMWGIKNVKTVPVIISSMGLIPKTLAQSLTELSLPLSIRRSMQKSVVLDATNIVRSFLNA